MQRGVAKHAPCSHAANSCTFHMVVFYEGNHYAWGAILNTRYPRYPEVSCYPSGVLPEPSGVLPAVALGVLPGVLLLLLWLLSWWLLLLLPWCC